MVKTKHHQKLTAQERDLIALWKGGGVSQREIARRLGRSHSTIIDETRRNRFGETYVAIHAQYLSDQRKANARKRHYLKDAKTYAHVISKLQEGWSPEQIAGTLRKKQGETVICYETIYQFIYSEYAKDKKLWEYLPWKRTKRRKKHGRIVHRGRIPNRISIHQRPEAVNSRLAFGHWEGDTVEGRGHRGGIHTEVERLSRFMIAAKVCAITSEEAIATQKKIFSKLPTYARHSTTLDNGKENHLHSRLKRLGMITYFADPYSSWQRGTNEYHNGLLRRYLPKGTSFVDLAQEELDNIVWEINNRPRKVLNFNTPQEVFNLYLGGRIQD